MRFVDTPGLCSLMLILTAAACSSGSGDKGASTDASADALPADAPPGTDSPTGPAADTGTPQMGGPEGGVAPMGGPDGGASVADGSTKDAELEGGWYDAPWDHAIPTNDTCVNAKTLALDVSPQHIDIQTDTRGAVHDVDAPCNADKGANVFYEVTFSKPVIVYADTFGAGWDTVLFLLNESCQPITDATMQGDAVCNVSACGTAQSQVVALLAAGTYHLGLSGAAGSAGPATIHFEWAVAGNGGSSVDSVAGPPAQLPQGPSTQTGTTTGAGNIDTLTNCAAAGPENSYWWASCPSDPAGSLTASTCSGATWETDLEVDIPAASPYSCTRDTCGLQASVTANVPAGAGLRVLTIDGEVGGGAYSMDIVRP